MKLSILLILLVVANAQAQKANIVPFGGKTTSRPRDVISTPIKCEFANLKLPKDTIVYAAGAYTGYSLNRQIDQSGHTATQMDVTVNSKKPVALILGSYEPTIWNIGWTKKTNIVAILVGGYHRQEVAGLKEGTPLLVSSYENNNECGYFYLSSDNMPKINNLSQKLFGKAVDTAFAATAGVVTVGDTLTQDEEVVTSDWKKVDSFFDRSAPLAGQLGLDDAVEKGLIRAATQADFDIVAEAINKEKGIQDSTKLVGLERPRPRFFSPKGTFVVLKKFTFPSGLYGGNSAGFIILKGSPTPTGDAGHSFVYNLNNSPICQGPMCRMGQD